MPLVSVIMSVYNEEKYIQSSIQSILNQTIQDWELIIIDDCSDDGTINIIKSFDDERICLYINDSNCGLTKNLNKALSLCRGKYIARMDGDDISLPNRFERQIEYLDKHKDVQLVSCVAHIMGTGNDFMYYLGDPEELRVQMLFRSVLVHPGFMMRYELVEQGYRYNEDFITAQDYEFLSRVVQKHKICNVNEPLIEYRVHSGQVSRKRKENQVILTNRIRDQQLYRVGVHLDEEDKECFDKWCKEEVTEEEIYVKAMEFIGKVVAANATSCVYNEKILRKELYCAFYRWVILSTRVCGVQLLWKILEKRWRNITYCINAIYRLMRNKYCRRYFVHLLMLYKGEKR